MIGALIGTVWYKEENPIIIVVGGVGYNVYVTENVLRNIKTDQEQILHIYTHIRDDEMTLFGFITREELRLFKLLLDVPGIGPRSGLLIINGGVSSIEKAVSESDVEFFSTIPRIGKKNAQKIIIELKSKLGSTNELNLEGFAQGETRQIIEALESMGFDKRDILVVIKKIPSNDKRTIEQKIRFALQNLGKK